MFAQSLQDFRLIENKNRSLTSLLLYSPEGNGKSRCHYNSWEIIVEEECTRKFNYLLTKNVVQNVVARKVLAKRAIYFITHITSVKRMQGV